ncbi:ATP-binding cassette domain-containing protein [Actinomyces sp. W5033]|uniref:ABC transporter ATP-binding protein n=1 Tax=Actinomyces sp. W5033 TaxID=3446479 RepID=UPI003EDEC0B4
MEPAVVVKNLTKSHGTLTALEDVSFEVAPGEILGIIGPNGAGKTTCLECLEGLREPTSGTLRVLGADPTRPTPAWRARIGVQLQTAALPPRIRVSEALELFASFYDNPVDSDTLLTELGIAAKSNDYVDKLSGGQRQRVFIALALISRPELVFLDELTTALDPQARLAMWDVVRSIRDGGTTVVMTTHDMDEAEALCDRVGIIDHGRLIALDTVPALIAGLGGGAQVNLRTSRPIEARLLDGVEGLSATTAPIVRGNELSVHVPDTRYPQHIIDAIEATGVTVSDVRVSTPSLEDVFLSLTGRSMREEKQA